MTRRSRIWLAIAVLFSLANLAGAVIALTDGELLHTALHVVLMLLGSVAVSRIATRSVTAY